MQALILVGGHGTRLRPVTLTLPKPIIPLVDRPFLRYMIDWLARHGVGEIVLACGFLPDQLRATLGDEIEGGPRLRYVEEPEPRGTAGAIKFAADLLDDRFFALNGDVLTDLDLTALVEQHEASGARATLALHPVEDPTGYGLVRRAEDGEIREFLEKPDPAEIDTDEVNAGAYVVERSAIELIPPGRAVSFEREVFPRLVGQGLYGRRLQGYWMDIGTPERYLQASWDILEGRVATEVEPTAPGLFVGAGAELSPQASIGPRAVIGPGSSVAGDAVVADSVLLDGCRICSGAEVRGAILAPGAEVGEGARIAPGAVLGRGAVVGPGAEISEDARVPPAEVISR